MCNDVFFLKIFDHEQIEIFSSALIQLTFICNGNKYIEFIFKILKKS